MRVVKYMLGMAAIGLMGAGVAAMGQEQVADLKAGAVDDAVQEELKQPDGVSFQLLPAGGWRIYARGTAAYDFNDDDEILDATKEAQLKAKAALAKFLNETLTTTDTLDSITKKQKKLVQANGKTESPEVTKENVKVTVESIKNSASQILQGVLTMESSKVPTSKEGGTIQVTIGVSDKSLGAAKKVKREIGKPLPEESRAQGGSSTGDSAPEKRENKPETRKTKTDF